MKKTALIFIITLILILTACSSSVLSEPYVFFYEGGQVSHLSGKEIKFNRSYDYKDYKSKYAEYNTYTYFSKLNDSEKLVYKILEYAFDNSYSNIFFDEKLINSISYSIEDILFMFSLDSPLVEQNLIKKIADFNYDSFGFDNESHGQYAYIENFSKDRFDKKLEALSKAKDILNQTPEKLSPLEKAEYIYRYLGENITYQKYTEDQSRNYLYDALCLGATQCDGFANAFSLLCNMSGIPCFEKMHTSQDKEGHTWNTFYVNGIWYNADSTQYDSMIPKLPRFGYPDGHQPEPYLYSELLPLCKESLFEIDFAFDVCESDSDIETISTAFVKAENKCLIFTLNKRPENLTNFFNKIGNNINYKFSYIEYGGLEQYVYCLYVKNKYD